MRAGYLSWDHRKPSDYRGIKVKDYICNMYIHIELYV